MPAVGTAKNIAQISAPKKAAQDRVDQKSPAYWRVTTIRRLT